MRVNYTSVGNNLARYLRHHEKKASDIINRVQNQQQPSSNSSSRSVNSSLYTTNLTYQAQRTVYREMTESIASYSATGIATYSTDKINQLEQSIHNIDEALQFIEDSLGLVGQMESYLNTYESTLNDSSLSTTQKNQMLDSIVNSMTNHYYTQYSDPYGLTNKYDVMGGDGLSLYILKNNALDKGLDFTDMNKLAVRKRLQANITTAKDYYSTAMDELKTLKDNLSEEINNLKDPNRPTNPDAGNNNNNNNNNTGNNGGNNNTNTDNNNNNNGNNNNGNNGGMNNNVGQNTTIPSEDQLELNYYNDRIAIAKQMLEKLYDLQSRKTQLFQPRKDR